MWGVLCGNTLRSLWPVPHHQPHSSFGATDPWNPGTGTPTLMDSEGSGGVTMGAQQRTHAAALRDGPKGKHTPHCAITETDSGSGLGGPLWAPSGVGRS